MSVDSAMNQVLAVYPNAFVTRDNDGYISCVCIIADANGERISNWCLLEENAWASAAYRLKPKPEPAKKPRVRVVLSRDDEPTKPVKDNAEIEVCDLFAGEEQP